MANTSGQDLANEVARHLESLPGYNSRHERANHLISSAMFQVGFARIARGLARWSHDADGRSEMSEKLADEQFDVLIIAPIDYVSRTAKSCLDLCAAAAFRMSNEGEMPWREASDRECDVAGLIARTKTWENESLPLLRSQQAGWLRDLETDPEFKRLKMIRDAFTHQRLKSHANPPDGAGIIVRKVRYDGVELAEAFVALAEAQFDAYAHAVLSDFPSDPATGRDEAAGR